MNRRLTRFTFYAGTMLALAGCGKTDDAALPKVAANNQSLHGMMAIPALPAIQLPDPVVPKGIDEPAGKPAAPAADAADSKRTETDSTKRPE